VRRYVLAGRNALRTLIGFLAFRRTGVTSRDAELGLRGLYTTDPRLPRTISRAASFRHRPRIRLPAYGALSCVDDTTLHEVVSVLRRDGCHVFAEPLEDAALESLIEWAASHPSYARLTLGPRPATIELDRGRLVAGRYDYDEADIVQASAVQRLACDPTMSVVADAYLNCKSALANIAMWRSFAFGSEPSSEAAQLFHSDRDYMQFLKFFVYLTDVTADTGPHVYVRGSHRVRPTELRRDVRFADDKVLACYGADAIVELRGPRGTVLAVDTSGLHKGKLPERGERLMLQFEFASTLFGTNAPQLLVRTPDPQVAAMISAQRRRFARFEIAQADTN
jgi:hypothetical protein